MGGDLTLVCSNRLEYQILQMLTVVKHLLFSRRWRSDVFTISKCNHPCPGGHISPVSICLLVGWFVSRIFKKLLNDHKNNNNDNNNNNNNNLKNMQNPDS